MEGWTRVSAYNAPLGAPALAGRELHPKGCAPSESEALAPGALALVGKNRNAYERALSDCCGTL